MLLQAYQGTKATKPAGGHHHFASSTQEHGIEIIRSLVALYEATGNTDEAAKWTKELAERPASDASP